MRPGQLCIGPHGSVCKGELAYMKYLVGTGVVLFNIEAASPKEAIAQLKQRIDARRNEHHNPEIGMSLVEALDAHRLSFVVMDPNRTQFLAGELNWFEDGEPKSRYEEV